jgi:nitronate monooxygenase
MNQKMENLKAQLKLPLIVAPMFLISNPEMALAACRSGIVGSFPALNQRTSAGLESWLVQMNDTLTQERISTPYAVNLIVHKTNARLEEDLNLCIKHKVPVIITSLGIVPEVIEKIHSYGGIVIHDVTNIVHAKKAAGAGVDGLIAVSAGAGGHAGTLNPFVLVGEIRQFFDGAVILAGGLSQGQDILAAEAVGADFAYMGTRFINTLESAAAPEHKQMINESGSADIIYTASVSGVPANFLKKSVEKAFTPEQLKGSFDAQTQLKSLDSEAKAWKTIFSAGQGVSNIHDIPSIAALVDRLSAEYTKARVRLLMKVPATKNKFSGPQ